MDSIKAIENEVDNKETVYYVKCELCGIKHKLLKKRMKRIMILGFVRIVAV